MSDYQTRRQFIKQVAYALAAGLTTRSLYEEAFARSSYRLSRWTGDNFTVGHRLREGKIPRMPSKPEKSVDVVIVGGGMAGLAAAHYLDTDNFLLLEQYEDLGGQSRGAEYRGIAYSLGAAYYSEPRGNMAELVDTMGLKPQKLTTEKKNAWYWEDKLVNDDTTGTSQHPLHREMARLAEQTRAFANSCKPSLLATYRDNAKLRKLDEVTLESILKEYDPRLIKLLDAFSKSSLCGSVKNISAFSGLSLLIDLIEPTYVLPGCNPALASALEQRLEERAPGTMKRGAFVWSIEIKEDGASVVYGHGHRRLRRVDCKHVVIAIPHLVAARVIKNLPNATRSNLMRFRYGSYLVANLLLRERIFQGAFDSWYPRPYDFADISIAETPYLLAGEYKESMGSVLTVYQPYEPGTIGRTLLLKGDRKAIADKLISQLTHVIPGIDGKLDELVLTRWGHAMAVTRPHYFKLVDALQKSEGRSFSFAHCSAQGLPCGEDAIDAARRVSDKIKKKQAVAPVFYSIGSTMSG